MTGDVCYDILAICSGNSQRLHGKANLLRLVSSAVYRPDISGADSPVPLPQAPHCPPHLAVYSLVQEWVPFPWCLLIYIAGFTAAAGAMLLIAMGVGALIQKFRKVAA